MEDLKALTLRCKEMKLKALEMALSTAFGAHIGGGFSLMEIMAALYSVANIPSMSDPSRDRIILSKGHGVLALYTALWQNGYVTADELATFETDGTLFHGHPHRNLEKGIEFSGGSLGLGLSYAVGVAMACKRRGYGNRVYVIVGDGEMDEGIIWESLMSIVHFGLDNITLIVDQNHYQLDGETNEVMSHPNLKDRLAAFGFEAVEINGHSMEQLVSTLPQRGTKPIAIIADTIKANGISFLMSNKMSHQCTLTKKKYQQAVTDIIEAYGE